MQCIVQRNFFSPSKRNKKIYSNSNEFQFIFQYSDPSRPWPPTGPSPAASPGPSGHPLPPQSPQHGPPQSPGGPSPSPQPPQPAQSPHQV